MTFIRSNYPPNWTSEIVPRIRARDNFTCVFCGVPDRTLYYTSHLGTRVVLLADEHGHLAPGQVVPPKRKVKRIILTTAHLDHKLVDHRDENLASLCQACHLNYDRQEADAQRQASRAHGALATRKNPQQQVLAFAPVLPSADPALDLRAPSC